jgi:hypothetical protein
MTLAAGDQLPSAAAVSSPLVCGRLGVYPGGKGVTLHLQAVDLALQRALRLLSGRQLAARLAQLRRLPVAVRPAAPAARAHKSARPNATGRA